VKKDTALTKHAEIDVPNLQVMNLMKSLKSKGHVRETFNWNHYYFYLTDTGIVYLRDYLHLLPTVTPATLTRSARQQDRVVGERERGGRPRDGPPRGDRGEYRGERPAAGGADQKKLGGFGEQKPEFRGFGRATAGGVGRGGPGAGRGRATAQQ